MPSIIVCLPAHDEHRGQIRKGSLPGAVQASASAKPQGAQRNQKTASRGEEWSSACESQRILWQKLQKRHAIEGTSLQSQHVTNTLRLPKPKSYPPAAY